MRTTPLFFVTLVLLLLCHRGRGQSACYENWDVAGTNIKSVKAPNNEECYQLCLDNVQCTFTVYFYQQQVCWLKKNYNKGPNGQTGPHTGIVTCKTYGARKLRLW